MDSCVLPVPQENIGRLIGSRGRNICFVKQMIAPGNINIVDNVVTIQGNFKNTQWKQRAIRIIRSAHRGGIIKWFDEREASRLTKHTREQWLCAIRGIESKTNTSVHQQHIWFKDVKYEVWIVLELSHNSNLECAIIQIGNVIHKRYSLRDINYKSDTSEKMNTIKLKNKRTRKERHRSEKEAHVLHANAPGTSSTI